MSRLVNGDQMTEDDYKRFWRRMQEYLDDLADQSQTSLVASMVQVLDARSSMVGFQSD